MTDGIRDALGMDSKNRENRDGETIIEASELRTLRQQLHHERERAESAERDNERLGKYAQKANQRKNEAEDRAKQAESRCNHLTNECAKLARRNADIEKERDVLVEGLCEIQNQGSEPWASGKALDLLSEYQDKATKSNFNTSPYDYTNQHSMPPWEES